MRELLPATDSPAAETGDTSRDGLDLAGQETFRAWNDRMASIYNPDDYHQRSHFLVRFVERRRVNLITKWLNAQPAERILEVGCGAGNLMEAIGKGRVYGLDLCQHLLRVAQERTSSGNCHLVQAYAEQCPFASRTFDKVYCSEVLEHVRDPDSILREIRRLLKDDGVFVASVPNEKTIDRVKRLLRLARLDRWFNRSTAYKVPHNMTEEWHLQEFDPPGFRAMLERHFKVRRVGFVPSRLIPLRMVALCTTNLEHR